MAIKFLPLNADLSAISNELTALIERAERGDFAMINLDYTNPLHSFGSVLTYTATQECYLFGSVTSGAYAPVVTINGNVYYNVSTNTGIPTEPVKLNIGDTVTVSHTMPYLHVLKKK